MDSSGWTVTDHGVHNTTDDDFQHFLDISTMGNIPDGINYDFHGFTSSASTHQMDTPMTGTGADVPMLLSPAMPALQQQVPAITTTAAYQSIPATMMPPPTPSEAIVNSLDAQIHFLQQQKLQAQQHQLEEQAAFFARQQTRIIPPTPQSLELPPGSNPFYAQHNAHEQQSQQPVDYRYQRAKEQADVCQSPYPGSSSRFSDSLQMSFTPLVSPAVTPLDTHFPVQSQFTVPGAYFSPLTSPALHAQADPLAGFEHRHGSMPASSPVDMDLDAGLPPVMPTSTTGDLPKKTRKNATKARAKTGVKQSPISKPLRKRTATTPSLNAQALNELMESAEQTQDYQQLPTAMMHTSSASTTTGPTDSENGSISPEALNDIVSPVEMPPPPVPKPKSAKPSPYIAPQGAGGSGNLQPSRAGIASPATPASLMKLSSPNTHSSGTRAGSQEVIDTEHIELFELPESANFSNPPAPASSDKSNETTTPKQSAKDGKSSKTPALAPLPSPKLVGNASVTGSAIQSPRLAAGPGHGSRRTPQLLPRGSSKRGSMSSVPVSPALRPKISPSIKPLLPGGPDVEETASLLLATKSNYQRILEGNTVPGVSYPSELSTNLTSKRTSHKIAEQGRRNRINSALQEIATLLPKQPKDSEGEGSDRKEKEEKDKDKGGGGGGVPNSKASTVEMAIEYIKQLQQEVAAANKRAEEAERKLVEQKEAAMDSSS
ncbi:helix-loop-helix DNA-binding domain-containing protein [Cladorrhinum sp. PSN332]|nr:helix-loop-helix DNA-binding domain-containing protein [Cladorrhinum sp. PSN332]